MDSDMARRALTQTTVDHRGEPIVSARGEAGANEGEAMTIPTMGLWAAVATVSLAWQESCENPVVFCYRIGREVFVRRAGLIPLSNEYECSSPSGTSSMSFTTSGD
jgi:hypothetical protein